jgi:hypothetical protein
MRRGWEVEYVDGKIINENQMDWRALPREGMVRVSLHHDGRKWTISNKVAYLQKKRASMVPGIAKSFQIESRSIGYYDIVEGKNCKIWYTVDEMTGKMTMEVQQV